MERDEQLRVIRGLMDHRARGTNVDAGIQVRNPVSAYTDPQLAEREWQAFFQGYPQILGLSADLPESGSFFTSEDLGKPVLCTRDEAGTFHAFLNVCRHRGALVEREDRGRKLRFSCPFHAWTYGADGSLLAVPQEHQFGTVDKACNSLVELPAVERHGLLWVSSDPAADPIDPDGLLGNLASELAGWKLAEARSFWQTRYDTPMNWKLAIDTFGETYHFNVLHRDTLAQSFHGNCQLYDTYGRNHRMMLCTRGIDLLDNLPESEWHVLKAALPVYYLFPNVQLIIGQEGPTLVRVYPCGPDPHQSYSQITFYTHEGMRASGWQEFGDAGVGAEERARGFAEVIQMEDYQAAAAAHKGAVSGAQSHVLFGRNEPALHHYHNTYREALNLPPLPVVED